MTEEELLAEKPSLDPTAKTPMICGVIQTGI
jgi:hypothetical protein